MVRIAGENIRDGKQVQWGLQDIQGIGLTTARKIREAVSDNMHVTFDKLSEAEIEQIRGLVKEIPTGVGADVRRTTQMAIKELRDKRCRRGIRHSRGLPVRGQNTQTNARTRKGPRKLVKK